MLTAQFISGNSATNFSGRDLNQTKGETDFGIGMWETSVTPPLELFKVMYRSFMEELYSLKIRVRLGLTEVNQQDESSRGPLA